MKGQGMPFKQIALPIFKDHILFLEAVVHNWWGQQGVSLISKKLLDGHISEHNLQGYGEW